MSERLKVFLESCLKLEKLPHNLKQAIESLVKNESDVPFHVLNECQRWFKRNELPYDPLWKLFISTSVALPTPKIPLRSTDLDQRVRVLQEKFANREYNKMIEGIGPKLSVPVDTVDGVTICSEFKCMNKQLIMVANFLIIVTSGFVFGYFIPDMLSSDSHASVVTRLVTNVFLSQDSWYTLAPSMFASCHVEQQAALASTVSNLELDMYHVSETRVYDSTTVIHLGSHEGNCQSERFPLSLSRDAEAESRGQV
ncbi:uncharacterized protein DEA37_0008331 [Paragonimus westermani]|uniref:Transmembrane protein n=1 Tax=Paragonimus westermani TaxID=34504 RepID=A0A5J4ND71_9TREM|nr:uncharacterized protein DEA37_0008331 [Paragonimus westermani]